MWLHYQQPHTLYRVRNTYYTIITIIICSLGKKSVFLHNKKDDVCCLHDLHGTAFSLFLLLLSFFLFSFILPLFISFNYFPSTHCIFTLLFDHAILCRQSIFFLTKTKSKPVFKFYCLCFLSVVLVFLLPFFFCALSHKEGRFSSFGSVGESVVFLRHCSEDDAHLKREMLQLYLAFDWMLRLLHFWDLRILYCRALWIFKTCLILWFEAKFDKHLSRKNPQNWHSEDCYLAACDGPI